MATPALRLELNLLDRALDKLDDFPKDFASAQPPGLQGSGGFQRIGQEAMDKGFAGSVSLQAGCQ
jgi:hypothetical protein